MGIVSMTIVGGLQSRTTDLGSGLALTEGLPTLERASIWGVTFWQGTFWGSRVSGKRSWIWCTLLGSTSWGLHFGSLRSELIHFGDLESLATDLGSGEPNTCTWGYTLGVWSFGLPISDV